MTLENLLYCMMVVSGNDAGVALYRSLGFTEHHRHRYAVWNG